MGHVVAEGKAHAGHFETVGEAVVYEDAARQGKHLGLVLHAPERGGEDEAVVIALEFRAVVVAFRVSVFLSEAFVGYKLLPVHNRFFNS
jgi:hypothetical protein